MPVSEIKGSDKILSANIGLTRKNDTEFARTLEKVKAGAENTFSQAVISDGSKSLANSPENFIAIGAITKENPTISHLLKSHPAYRKSCWQIIFSSSNKNKKYTEIPEESRVSINIKTKELIWERNNSESRKDAPLIQKEKTSDSLSNQLKQQIVIGTISKKEPTVSHLFQNHPDFDEKFWGIIYSSVNQEKPYQSLKPGTQVSIDMGTKELYFNDRELPVITASRKKHPPLNQNLITGSLDDAAMQYIGKPYEKIDCYGLIVRGLIDKGIQYNGMGGVKEQLKSLAKKKGLAHNAFLNGEGLVEHVGTTLYSKLIYSISDTQTETEKLYADIVPYLQKGLILSFSTHSSGHTGIISRHEKTWTYINSGDIDHEIFEGPRSKRVGEEFLKDEINNWCLLAANKKESLKVTLGEINETKI